MRHKIDPLRIRDQGDGTHRTRKTDVRLMVEGQRGVGFGIGAVPKGAAGRKVTEGPMVPGPWAFAFGLSSVIDNHGGTGAEIARERKEGRLIEAKVGDEIEIDGDVYRIEWKKTFGQVTREYVDLVGPK